jgi:hypothetical protein
LIKRVIMFPAVGRRIKSITRDSLVEMVKG